MAETSTASSGQLAVYATAIAFMTGVAGALAKLVQTLYQRMLNEKQAEIERLRKIVDECREQTNGD